MCYIVPAVAAITTTFAWKIKLNSRLFWLMLMLYGGSLFGVVDHLWNKELFLISENWIKDLTLGVVITAVIISAWGVMLAINKRNPSLAESLE